MSRLDGGRRYPAPGRLVLAVRERQARSEERAERARWCSWARAQLARDLAALDRLTADAPAWWQRRERQARSEQLARLEANVWRLRHNLAAS